MATATLTSVADLFGVGTTVGAYVPGGNAEFPVVGAALATAVVASDGSLAFTGLADDTAYVAYDPATGRRKRFRTPAVSSAGGTGPVGPTGPPGPAGTPGSAGTLLDEGVTLPLRSAINFAGVGIVAADDPANARTNVTVAGGVATQLGPISVCQQAANTTTDLRASMQTEIDNLDAAGGGEYIWSPGTYRIRSTSLRSHATLGSVSSGLKIPNNVFAHGHPTSEVGQTQLQFDDLGAGTFAIDLMDFGGLARTGPAPMLGHFYLGSFTATPSSFITTGIPPALMRGILCDNGGITNIYQQGNFRCGQYMVGDHFRTEDCSFFGWTAIEQGSPAVTADDNSWWRCSLQGSFCMTLVLGKAFTSASFYRCHMGQKSVYFYAYGFSTTQDFLTYVTLIDCSFEGGMGGLIIEGGNTRFAKVNQITFAYPRANALFDGQLMPTDVTGVTPGPSIKAAWVQDIHVIGPMSLFKTLGQDGPNSCIIDALQVANVELGEISGAMAAAEQMQVPLIRSATTLHNVTGRYTVSSGTTFVRTVPVRFVRTTTVCSRGDVAREGISNSLTDGAGTRESASRFDLAKMPVLGVFAQKGAVNDIVPVAIGSSMHQLITRVGTATAPSTITLPLAAATAAGTTPGGWSTDLGAPADPIPWLLEDLNPVLTTLNGGIIAAAATIALASTAGLPTAGRAFIAGNGAPVSWTGISGNNLTGVTGVAATIATGAAFRWIPDTLKLSSTTGLPVAGIELAIGTGVIAYSSKDDTAKTISGCYIMDGIGVAQPSSSSLTRTLAVGVGNATAFPAAGGVAQIAAGQRAVYRGRNTNLDRLTGVNISTGAGGAVGAGVAIADVTSLRLQGDVENWPQTNGSVGVGKAPYTQATYAEALQDRVDGGGPSGTLWLAGISGGSGSFNTPVRVVGGTRANGAQTAVTTLTVFSTTGLPSAGRLRMGATTVDYTAKTATTFALASAVTVADQAAVTPALDGTFFAGTGYLKPRLNSAFTSADDQGLAMLASDRYDSDAPAGQCSHVFAYAHNADDAGAVVMARLKVAQ